MRLKLSRYLVFAWLSVLFLLAGCAAQRAFSEGKTLLSQGNVESGLAKLDESVRLDPQNHEFRIYQTRQKELAVQQLLSQAEEARTLGKIDSAETTYSRILTIDPKNARALKGQEGIARDRRLQAQFERAEDALKKGDNAAAYEAVNGILAVNPSHRAALLVLRKLQSEGISNVGTEPRLKDAFRKPMTIEFRDASLRQIFELISRNTGLNFLFDKEVRSDLRASLMVRDTSVEEVVRFVLSTNQLEQRILNESTVFIYPATEAKLKQYQDLLVKSFYVGNADVKEAANLIKTVLKAKDLYVNERLGIVSLRDTPAMVRAVERLLASHDLAEPEVILDVEVLELGSNLTTELGIQYPDHISAGIMGADGTAGTVSLKDVLNRSSSMVQLSTSNPAFSLNFRDQTGNANILANPRIRVKNREKAKIHIGDKVPVITTSTTSTGVMGESVSYLDVGLKLEVEPDIHIDDEVGIKVGLEVSNIAQQVKSANGTLTYQLGTRNANTVLRIKDGETQALAGLLSDEERSSANRLPGLGSLPVIGRLFGSQGGTSNKTEIVLLITPHIVRSLTRPDLEVSEFMAGTESSAGASPLYLQSRKLVQKSSKGEQSSEPSQAVEEIGEQATSVGAAAPAPRALLLTANQVMAGQEFKVLVALDSSTPAQTSLLELVYDPALFHVVGVVPGAAMREAPDDKFQSTVAEEAGRIAIRVTPEKPLSGKSELASITMVANPPRAMSASLRIEAASITDSKGRSIPLEQGVPVVMSLIK